MKRRAPVVALVESDKVAAARGPRQTANSYERHRNFPFRARRCVGLYNIGPVFIDQRTHLANPDGPIPVQKQYGEASVSLGLARRFVSLNGGVSIRACT
jgi:hypothetical protein